MVQEIKLLYTQEKIGKGIDDDPIRLVDQLWTHDGKKVAEFDFHTGKMFFRSDNIKLKK